MNVWIWIHTESYRIIPQKLQKQKIIDLPIKLRFFLSFHCKYVSHHRLNHNDFSDPVRFRLDQYKLTKYRRFVGLNNCPKVLLTWYFLSYLDQDVNWFGHNRSLKWSIILIVQYIYLIILILQSLLIFVFFGLLSSL